MNYTEKHFRNSLIIFFLLFIPAVVALIMGLTGVETKYSVIVFTVSFVLLLFIMTLRAFVVRCELCDSYVINTKVYKNTVSSQLEKEFIEKLNKENGVSLEVEVEPEFREFKCQCGHINRIKFSVSSDGY